MVTIFKNNNPSHILHIPVEFHYDIRRNELFTEFFHIPGSDPSTGGPLKNDRMETISKNNIPSHILNYPVEFHYDIRRN